MTQEQIALFIYSNIVMQNQLNKIHQSAEVVEALILRGLSDQKAHELADLFLEHAGKPYTANDKHRVDYLMELEQHELTDYLNHRHTNIAVRDSQALYNQICNIIERMLDEKDKGPNAAQPYASKFDVKVGLALKSKSFIDLIKQRQIDNPH